MAKQKTTHPVEAFPEAPNHLSERSKALWISLGPTRCTSVGRRNLLQVALEALDRAEEARQAIVAQGLTKTTQGTGAIHVNPLLKVERDCRNQFAGIWRQLRLDQSSDLPAGWPYRV